MTNNIAVTEGSGKTVATEDIGGVQYQKVIVAGSVATVGTAVANQSVSGTINIGTIPGSVIAFPTGNQSVSGSVGIVGTPSISGTVNITGTPSVSGSVNISSIFGAITLFAQPDSFVSNVTSIITTTGAVSVLGAPGSALRNYITQITVTNAAATATFVDVKDTGANILHSGYAAASGGGYTATFLPGLKQLNTNSAVDVISRSQASIIVAVSGYKAA